jgi:hypothetical protein
MARNFTITKRQMRILRLGRAVAIPKPDGGIRPITLTSSFMKLCGLLVWKRSGTVARVHLRHQYAIGSRNGCERIVHNVRADYEQGLAIIKIDIVNAFNETSKSIVFRLLQNLLRRNDSGEISQESKKSNNNTRSVEEMLKDFDPDITHEEYDFDTLDADIIKYFCSAYWDEAKIAVYGPEFVTAFIKMIEGLRQGDAHSSWFFSIVMFIVILRVERRCPGVNIRAFIDDKSVACKPAHARYVLMIIKEECKRVHWEVSDAKSKILCKHPEQVGCEPIVAFVQYNDDDNSEGRRRHVQRVEERTLEMIGNCDVRFIENIPYLPYVRDESNVSFVRKPKLMRIEEPSAARNRRELEAVIADGVAKLNVLVKTNETFDADDERRLQFMGNIINEYINQLEADNDDYYTSLKNMILQKTCNNEIVGPDGTFVVLGCNISDNHEEHNAKMIKRLIGFFDVLEQVGLHPQVAVTLARLCGYPKAAYFVCTTPPEIAMPVLRAFKHRAYKFLEKTLGFDVVVPGSNPVVPMTFTHHVRGLGMPDYEQHCGAVYSESRAAAILKLPQLEVSLVHQVSTVVSANQHPVSGLQASPRSEFPDAHAAAQCNPLWMQFQPRGRKEQLTPVEYRYTMAIRCNTLPKKEFNNCVRNHTSCCDNIDISTPDRLIAHALNCKKSGFTPATRHNFVKTAVASTLQRFGFHVRVEPTSYSHLYGSGRMERPDLTVSHPVPIPVTTDFVIVQQEGSVGSSAKAAAKRKMNNHDSAVSAVGHRFVPFALEAHGYEDPSVINFLHQISVTLPGYLKRQLILDVRMAVSCALARARYQAVVHVLASHMRSSNVFDAQCEQDVAEQMDMEMSL